MQDECSGEEVGEEYVDYLLNKYADYVSCIVFFGGENKKDSLKRIIEKARNKNKNLHFCLYTGRTSIEEDLLRELDYIKMGEYRKDLGGLGSKNTNQLFLDLKNNKDITNKFIRS
jgi:anaerobic ribonucleoside-triphosphate reductase activating protein